MIKSTRDDIRSDVRVSFGETGVCGSGILILLSILFLRKANTLIVKMDNEAL